MLTRLGTTPDFAIPDCINPEISVRYSKDPV